MAAAVAIVISWLGPAPSRATLLYDIQFAGDAIGSVPASTPGFAYPLTQPSSVTGSPTVVASSGPLVDQPLRFVAPPPVGSFQQIQSNFNLADVNQVDGKCIAAGGALRQCIVFSHPQFDITFDLTVSSLDPYPNDGTRFSALFDFPSVERLDFTRNGTIQTRFGLKTIGTYAFGALLHVEVLLDFVTGRWKISLNGTTLDDQPFASNYIDLVSLRFGLGTQATGGDAAIDNIRVVAVPEQSTGSLLLAGLALSTANRAYRRRC